MADKLQNMLRSIALASVLMIFLVSCAGDKKETDGISTNDVNNTASADGSEKGNLPDIKFEEEEHDFGRITQGEKVSFAFKFKNTGNSNLIITSAAGSCGCTVPEWPKEPILPGKEGKVNVIFSSEGKSGLQEKSINIVTNCEPSTRTVKIKTEIIVPETLEEN
ncbi:MAG: DUF1573 domain-containing protein [Bacteroidia bacterium]|nr:DUF1573 domain-containing protein [Bacteroidia bacterium]